MGMISNRIRPSKKKPSPDTTARKTGAYPKKINLYYCLKKRYQYKGQYISDIFSINTARNVRF